MTPRSAEKLLTSLQKPTRRAQFSSSTRRTLVEVARELFATQGYAGTSLDAIVSRAKVTKGALYHHFSGKQALFEAVFETVESEASAHIRASLKARKDPWDKAQAGLDAFLEVVRQPTYQRVVIQEGPAILGYERFREQEERSSYAIVQDIVRSVLGASEWELDEGMLTTFSQIFFGAMSAAGESISNAEDPGFAVAQVHTALGYILAGLRALADSGIELPDPQSLLREDEPDSEGSEDSEESDDGSVDD